MRWAERTIDVLLRLVFVLMLAVGIGSLLTIAVVTWLIW